MESSPLPLYHQIAIALRARLADGEYQVGDLLPSEPQLAEEFSVSRATIRQAVGELTAAGLVSRRAGRGTVVLPPASKLLGQVFRGSLKDLLSETRRSTVRDVTIETGVALPQRIADALGLAEPRGAVVERTRVMDDRVFAFTRNYLPERHGDLLSVRGLERESLMWILLDAGVELSWARQSIRAEVAAPETAARLQVGAGAAVLFVERLVSGPGDAPVEFVQTWYRGDAYAYTVEFSLGERSHAELMGQLA